MLQKKLKFVREHKDWSWKMLCGQMIPDLSCFREMVRRGVDEALHPSCLVPTIGQRYDLELLQLVRFRFSKAKRPKNLVIWLPEYTEWTGLSIQTFFHPWWHGHILRWQCRDSSGSNCERVVMGAWDIIFTHELATTEFRPSSHWESLGCAGLDFMQCS